MEIIKIKISPEFLESDIVQVTSSGYTFGVYTGLTSILQGNTGGTSLLTGLTFPILLKQKYQDIGYYDGFDGNITQQVISANFSFTASTESPYTVSLFNNSSEGAVYLIDSTYTIDWGDGSSQVINSFYPEFINHTYANPLPNPTSYTITLRQENMWGTVTTTKTVNVPYSPVDNSNPYGTVTFANTSGSWSASPQTYNFIYTADSYNEIAYQIGSYYGQVLSMYADGRIQEWTRVAPERVTYKTNAQQTEIIGYTVDGLDVPSMGVGSLVVFNGLDEGFLSRAGRTIRAAVALENASEAFAKEPVPMMVLKSNGTNLTSERIGKLETMEVGF